MNKIFLDVGAHMGQSIDTFRKFYSDSSEYKIYAWEPDMRYEKLLMSKNIKDTGGKLFMKAAWTNTESRKLYINEAGHGNSMYHEKITGGINKNDFIEVECMDFAHFIVDNFSKDDYIIMKFNTEGSEFEVFPHMLSVGAFEYINKLFGEWHDAKVPIFDRIWTDKLLSDVEKYTGKFIQWRYDSSIFGLGGEKAWWEK